MRKWMKYITAAFIGINCLFTSCQLYEQIEEYFLGDDNASETESEDEESIRLVVSNSSSCKVRISLGSSTECSSGERQFLCEIKPSYQLQKTISRKNTVLFYEYYFDDSMCPLVKKVDICTSGEEFKFNITEIDFSETMNAAVLVFSNNTGGEIDVRNSNMVVQSADGNETICSGTSSVYRIEESGPVNYFNYGCFYVYTAEENFSFSNITLEKNMVYFFAVREDGLVLLKEYSFNSYAKDKAGISVDSEIENLGKEEMPFLLVNNRYEAKISLHNRSSVSSTMYVALIPDEGLVIEGNRSKGFFLNPMKENSAYTFPLTVSCNSEFGSGYEVKKIHVVVSDTKPTQTVFLEQDIEFVFFKGMSLWNLSVSSPLGTNNGKVDVSVGNTLFNIDFSVENNKTKQIYLPSVENDAAFIRLEASKSSEQWCYSISKNETKAPENVGDSAFQSICFQEPQNDSKNTAQNFGTSMQGYLSENDVDFYRIDLKCDDTEIYYEKSLKLHLKDSMVKVYIKTARDRYYGIELYSLGNYPSFIQVKYGTVLEDCLKNEFGSDGYKRIGCGWYFRGWYMNIDKKTKLDTSMLVTEEMTVYPVYYC